MGGNAIVHNVVVLSVAFPIRTQAVKFSCRVREGRKSRAEHALATCQSPLSSHPPRALWFPDEQKGALGRVGVSLLPEL